MYCIFYIYGITMNIGNNWKKYLNINLKSDEDKANFAKLIEIIKESKKGKTLGVFSKENYPGAFMDAWRTALKTESFDTVSVKCHILYISNR